MKNQLIFLGLILASGFSTFAQNITSVQVSSGNQGTVNLPVSIVGSATNFSNATNSLVRFTQGTSTLNNFQIESANAVSSDLVDAVVSIPYGVSTGFYNVEVYDEILNDFVELQDGFQVLASTVSPTMSGTNPSKTSSTQILPVTMFVENAHFSQATDNVMHLSQGTNTLMPISGSVQVLNDHYLQAEFNIGQANPIIGSYFDVYVANGFDGSFMDYAAIEVTESTSISGLINYTGSVYTGPVELYQKTSSSPDHYTKVSSVDTDVFQYTYEFLDVAEAEYLLRAVPTGSTSLLSSYYPSTVQWQNATEVQSTPQGVTGIDITPVVSFNSNGLGNVAGSIGFGPNGFFKANIVYQEGLEVFLKNITTNTFAQTLTDVNGAYHFNNVPNGSYSLEINIPGYTQVSTYDITLTNGTSAFEELDFLIDENEIFTFASLSVTELSDEIFQVYPNPSTGIFTVKLLDSQNNMNVQVTNQLGKVVYNKDYGNVGASGDVRLDLSKFASGLYFMKVTTDSKQANSRLVIRKH